MFTIEVDGREVPCAISRSALQALGGRYLRNGDLLPSFARFRERITGIAAAIFAVRPESIAGLVSIWADDIDDPPRSPAVSAQVAQQCQA